MTRNYDEPIGMRPEAFVWRGRRYLVRAVLAHWVEVGPWWRATAAATADPGAGEREVWRVEATPDPAVSPGVYDVCRDGAGGWRLVRTID